MVTYHLIIILSSKIEPSSRLTWGVFMWILGTYWKFQKLVLGTEYDSKKAWFHAVNYVSICSVERDVVVKDHVTPRHDIW